MSILNTKPTKVVRFCSIEEYRRLISGEYLYNPTNHAALGRPSTSVGFCFAEDDPATAWRYLKGIVDVDICLQLVFKPGTLTKSKGRYADYSNGTFSSLPPCIKREWCCTTYSLSDIETLEVITDFCQPQELYLAKSIKDILQKSIKNIENELRHYNV